MSFLNPIWLLALVPWAVVSVWMFLGRRPGVAVPFVQLWQGPIASHSRQRNFRLPPIGVLLALLAILFGLLAAARPVIRRPGTKQAHFTLILDRGITMSALVNGGYRYVEAATALSQALSKVDESAVVDFVSIPGATEPDLSLRVCLEQIKLLPPTAMDTAAGVRDEVSALRLAGKNQIVLISDQVLDLPPEIIRISPGSPVEDVAIIKLAARELPAAQVMIRVRNDSNLRDTALKIESGADTKRVRIDLPSRGAERDYFVDLAHPASTISAELKVMDDQPADNRAWLVREGNSPRIEARVGVSAGLRRMIDVYTAHRPPGDDSSRILVAGEVSALPGDANGVVVPAWGSTTVAGPIGVVDHPINRNVNWPQLAGLPISVGEAPAGWLPVLSEGGKALVAVGPGPARQVWVGLDAADWDARPDFVIFWSNVFEWLGGGGTEWVGHSLNEWSSEWRCGEVTGLMPGLYRRSDGAVRAFNPPDVRFPAPPQGDWQGKLWDRVAPVSRFDLTTILLIAALSCVCISAAVSNGRTGSPTRRPEAVRVA